MKLSQALIDAFEEVQSCIEMVNDSFSNLKSELNSFFDDYEEWVEECLEDAEEEDEENESEISVTFTANELIQIINAITNKNEE
jgi:ssRNA-specific RNase YbeY (16S rRNA maturation enzyme)